ncbi:unnamed protein product, partial [Candidula unifasciata]
MLTELCLIATAFDNDSFISNSNTETYYISREQSDYYINIIMKVKAALHWMSAIMCSLALLSFTRAKVCNTSKGFLTALNLFELVASVTSI